MWQDAMWQFSRSGDGVADKKLLPFPEDSFQFSVANEHSKQDFHRHAGVLEIYVSHFPIELFYAKGVEEEHLRVPSGILIVPPGVAHRVQLHGLTFVFQVVIGSGHVHDDKDVIEPPSRAANQ